MPDNAIIGDAQGIDLPQATPDPNVLSEEKNMAKYAKSEEFARIKAFCTDRIAFYQSNLPDGRPLGKAGLSMDELGRQWIAANVIVTEFSALMNIYENVQATVDEAKNG